MNNKIKTLLIICSLLIILTVLLVGLGNALVPLIIAFGVAYLFFPLIKKIERYGIKRNYAVLSVFSLIIIAAVIVFLLIIPDLITDSKIFLKELPQNSIKAADKIEQLGTKFGFQLDLSKQGIKEILTEHTSFISTDLMTNISKSAKGLLSNFMSWFLSLLNIFLIPLFFFYVINDYEKFSNEFQSFLPKKIQPKINHYFGLANTVLSGYIRGQLMVAAILGILYGIGLWICGLNFGFLIGLASGLISIIPYAGLTIGFLTSIMMALANFSGFGVIIGIIFVFVIVQLLEGFIITPKLVGNKVGLSSFVTMLALIIGGNLFGLVGMLLAIPMAAITKSILAELKTEYQGLALYSG